MSCMVNATLCGLRLESIDWAAVGEPAAIETFRAISVSSKIELRRAVNVINKVKMRSSLFVLIKVSLRSRSLVEQKIQQAASTFKMMMTL